MTKLNPTPLARRHLNDQARNQPLTLGNDLEMWQSDHLRRAFEIVAKQRSTDIAKQIVLKSVRAAGAAVKEASKRHLETSRRSAWMDFNANCRAIANCTKSTRLRREVRMTLDEATRSALTENAIDLEWIQNFFSISKRIVERWQEDKNARAIFKHLVTIKAEVITYDAAFPLQDRVPKIALDYEALPMHVRLACERSLQIVIAEKSERLSAHDVFASLHTASKSLLLGLNLQEEPAILDSYLAEIGRIWIDQGLRPGRGNHLDNTNYMSPFQEFAERVLLVERDPGSRTFNSFTSNELKSSRKCYESIPRSARDNIRAAPFAGTRVITDHLLRSYLKRSKK